MARVRTLFVCQSCGHQANRWLGRCPDCGEWNSLVEEAVVETPAGRATTGGGGFLPPGPDVSSPDSLAGFGGPGSTPGALAPAPAPVEQKLFRVGGIIREPKKVLHVAPEYPELARRAGVEGVVVLEAVVDVSGRVTQVRVLRPVALLDAAAVNAVRPWRYSPTELNGVPVPVLMTVTVRFALR